MLHNLITEEVRVGGNRIRILQKDSENSSEGACKQCGSLKENVNEYLYSESQRDSWNFL